MFTFTSSRRVARRLSATVASALALVAGACADQASTIAPELPGNGPVSAFRPVAFVADVNVRDGVVRISSPASGTTNGAALGLGGDDRAFSLLGGEAVRLIPSDFQASAVGAFTPGLVRVTFKVVIENKLPGIKFITPTWPVPPADGVILFPLEQVVTTTPGGVTGGDGNDIIVESPSYGLVRASIDWSGTGAAGSGAPYNFFNDGDCSGTSNDCFRWEAYDLEILPAPSTSAERTIGFDIDPTVGQFRARMIVAADLAAAGAIAPATLRGAVTSAVRGPLDGAVVNVSGGFSDGSDATGAYEVTGIAPGTRTISLSNLPSGCTAPASQSLGFAADSSYTLNFAVECTGLPGSISGIVTRSNDGSPLAGATISAGGVSAVTDSTGAYSLAAVPAGAGSIIVTGAPAECSPFSQAFTLGSGASLTQDLTVTCTAPPTPGYTYNTSWVSLGAGQVALDLRIDMTTFNNLAIDDVTTSGVTGDPLTGAQLTFTYDASRLEFVEGQGTTSPNITAAPTVNGATAGEVNILNGSTVLRTGNVGIARIVFNVRAGASGSTVTTVTTLQSVSSRSGGVTLSIGNNVNITESSFVLP